MSEKISLLKRVSWILNIIFHQAVAVLTVYIISTNLSSSNVDSLATWHMVLAPLGIMFLMMESLILFNKNNLFTIYLSRKTRQYIHASLQILSTICITIGIAFRINTKETHFTTTHGILGLVTWILIWCSVFFGSATSQSQLFKGFIKPVWIKICHIFLGFSSFTLGVICLGYGLKDYMKWHSNEDVILAAIVTMAILYAWALWDTVKNVYSLVRDVVGK